MHVNVVGFIPPVEGIDNEFNTFRLGGAYAKRLTVGDTIFLMDEKNKVVFGSAQVTRVEVGKLAELCRQHASTNHRELSNDAAGAPERLLTYIRKIYGPHIAKDEKKACVIFMKRLE